MATHLKEQRSVSRPEDRDLSSLIGDLARETGNLMRKEVELAKTEMSAKVETAQKGAISIAAGGAVLYAGFLVLLLAVVVALDTLLDRWVNTNWLSPLIIGIIAAAVGYLMLKAGQKAMRTDTLVPQRTLRSLQRDAAFMQREAESTTASMQADLASGRRSSGAERRSANG